LRLLGGILFASGALVLLFREAAGWDDWAKFAGFAVPALVLLAIALPSRAPYGASGWQSAFFVFGTFLLLFALFQLVDALDGNGRDELNVAWCFGVPGALAVLTSFVRGAKYQMLLGSFFLAVAWVALWIKILDDQSGDTIRWLLVLLAAIYLGVAFLLARGRRPQASDLVTVGGGAAVAAGAFSFAGAAQLGSLGGFPGEVPDIAEGWNVYLLVVSLVLIAYGSRAVTRGPAYIGTFGLIGFIYLTGLDLVSRLKGDKPGDALGWPLILLIVGGGALIVSFFVRPRAPDGDGPAVGPVGGEGPLGAAAGPVAGAGPGAGPDRPTTPGYAQPPAPPQPPPPEQGAGGLLDQWRREPPAGPGGQ
jgi:hypothetical protein